MKYLTFESGPDSKSGKTKQWYVRSVSSNDLLGHVAWHGPWRKYVFIVNPSLQTLYDEKCLREIADFIEEKTREHKA